MDITISIVTYNSAPVIVACVEHAMRSSTRALEIVVSDNASQDPTLAQLSPWREKLQLLANKDNCGFGVAHNAALDTASGRYFLILNPDVALPTGSLDMLANYLDEHADCGAVAPLLDENGELRGCGNSYPGAKYIPFLFRSLPGHFALLQGACVLVRANVYREIKGFDPRFFLYGEDFDLSLEIRKHGHTLHCLKTLRVPHLSGHSTRSTLPAIVSAQKHLALLLFYRKHYPALARIFLISRDVLKSALRLVVLTFARTSRAEGRRSEYQGRLRATLLYLRGERRVCS
jgi:GT2 family glycosyltransferase